jgi:hypothetical protein
MSRHYSAAPAFRVQFTAMFPACIGLGRLPHSRVALPDLDLVKPLWLGLRSSVSPMADVADLSIQRGSTMPAEERRLNIDSARFQHPHHRLAVAKAVLAAGLTASGLFILIGFTKLWFTFDDWDFVAHRGIRLGSGGIFYPHNEHWTTIPILVWRAIFAVVGVRDYWLYAVPLILAHLATAYLLWRFMLRHQVELWIATLLTIAFALVGVGAQNLIWAFQFCFVGSVAFGMLAIDAIETDRIWLAPLWNTCSLMCSALGIPMTIASGCIALAQRRFRDAAIAVIPPALVFLVWFGAVGHRGISTSDSALQTGHIGGLIRYVWTGLTSSLSGFVDAPSVVGLLMVVLLAVVAVLYRNAPAALAVSVLPFYFFVGVGRLQDGASQATASRYSYLAIALVLPLVGSFLTWLVSSPYLRPLVMVALGLLVLVNVRVLHRQQQEAEAAGSPLFYPAYLNQRTQLDAAAYLLHRGETFPGQFASNSLCAIAPNPGQCLSEDTLDVPTLAVLVRKNQFPVPMHIAPGVLQAERSLLNVALVPAGGRQAGTNRPVSSHCATVGVYGQPVKVTSNSPDLVNVYVAPPQHSVITTVSFLALEGRAPAATIVVLPTRNSWLNLPFGRYRTAVITSVDRVRVCQFGRPPSFSATHVPGLG